ncbi:MAG TPA: transcription termination/antitermination protein NusG [bacterium]|nr:transcription termination/antitermination protein NusG [bacterium]
MTEDSLRTDLDKILPEEVDEFVKKDWYVLHTYSGLENKVRDNIITLVKQNNYAGNIYKVFVPIENVLEIKRGEKKQVQKKIFPSYILLQIDDLTEEIASNIKLIHGVTDFVTIGMDDKDEKSKPLPLPKNEIRNLLQKAVSSPTKPKTMYEVGDSVSIMSGPFADFVGIVDEVDIDKAKLKIMVDIFGRKTSVELNFDQVEKQHQK